MKLRNSIPLQLDWVFFLLFLFFSVYLLYIYVFVIASDIDCNFICIHIGLMPLSIDLGVCCARSFTFASCEPA